MKPIIFKIDDQLRKKFKDTCSALGVSMTEMLLRKIKEVCHITEGVKHEIEQSRKTILPALQEPKKRHNGRN